MKYIKKSIVSTPYYVPLSAHVIRSYTVNVDENVITANIESYFDEATLTQEDVQPLAHNSVVLVGTPAGDTLEWAYEQLVSGGDAHQNEYNFQGTFQMADRNLFEGGALQIKGV